MRYVITALVLLVGGTLFAEIYDAKSGEVKFFSETAVENISAKNTRAKSRLNTETKSILVKIKVIGFKFEKPLMEEHFNEKYLETEKFPNATFKGKIIDSVDFSKDGVYEVNVKGKLTIHGVTKERTIKGTVTVKGTDIKVHSKFTVKLVDHDIEVPSIVVSNIAEEIDVEIDMNYEPYVKKE